MSTQRISASATVLPSGEVLIAGASGTSELYDEGGAFDAGRPIVSGPTVLVTGRT